MFPKIPLVKTAIQGLNNATATVSTRQTVKDENNITRTKLVAAGSIRCRISYSSVPVIADSDTVDVMTAQVKMNYDPADMTIAPGSYVHVKWDDGKEEDFQNSSLPAIYTHHAELSLERVNKKP